ncbi:MAG: 30S ribosomal protein S6 [Candidatus Parcubacteria bacterium]|nr:30S ribosomal protein S6 [Candidatus Parcubacteria bacterium]
MKLYELTYLISPETTSEQASKTFLEMTDFIRKEGGIIEKEGKPLKKRLGIKIKKNRTALLSALDMYFDPFKINSLEKTLKENPQILRFLICSKKRIGETLGRPITRRRPFISATPEKEKETKKEKEKVGIEEIDKKLEEILG